MTKEELIEEIEKMKHDKKDLPKYIKGGGTKIADTVKLMNESHDFALDRVKHLIEATDID